jgi:hypothetical protein
MYPSSWLMLSSAQDGGKLSYEPAAQSFMQHLGAPERADPRDVGFFLMISALTFIYKMLSVNTEPILEILPNFSVMTE